MHLITTLLLLPSQTARGRHFSQVVLSRLEQCAASTDPSLSVNGVITFGAAPREPSGGVGGDWRESELGQGQAVAGRHPRVVGGERGDGPHRQLLGQLVQRGHAPRERQPRGRRQARSSRGQSHTSAIIFQSAQIIW